LKCNTAVPDDQERSDIKFKWSTAKRGYCRSGIIGCLPKINSIVEGIACNDRSSVNKAVNDFSDTMRSVADPLFSKCYRLNKTPYFVDQTCLRNKNWF